jgi:hypothetical protein
MDMKPSLICCKQWEETMPNWEEMLNEKILSNSNLMQFQNIEHQEIASFFLITPLQPTDSREKETDS